MDDEERKARARERAHKWYWANRERALERDKQWRAANPEKSRERQRRQYERTGREYQRQRRAANPELFRERRRARYAKERDKEIEGARRWQLENPVRTRELKREGSRRKKAIDPVGESERFRRMKMARLHGMQPEDWMALWDAQNGCCYLCGDDLGKLASRQVHVEHDHRCCPKETSCYFCRRGLACMRCNSLIGFARDDPALLRQIADNLEAALKDTNARLAGKPEQLTLEA